MTTQTKTKPVRNVLVIAPHADDEILGCGGTLLKLVEQGYTTYCVICCKRKDEKQIQAVRGNKKIHTKNLFFLNYPDERLYTKKDECLKKIEAVYNSLQPEIVFIPSYNDINLDHKVVNELSLIVCRRFQEHTPSVVYEYEVPSTSTQSPGTFQPNVYFTLTTDHVDTKVLAFYHYIDEIREFPNPRSIIGLQTYCKFRGMECNSEYAEGFKVVFQKL
jgi:LmbE family N-acetylglucosaminyl deacetylase